MPDRPIPAVEWDPPLAATVRRRRRPLTVIGGIGLALLGLSATLDQAIRPTPRFVWNASASVPIGLWRIHPRAPIGVGDIVLAHTPESVREMAAQRRYIPDNVPLLKRVAAVDGSVVCAFGPSITIDGRPAAVRRIADRLGRRLPQWTGCETLRNGRIFLLTRAPDSFDSRYFGPIDRGTVIGRATPLWLR